MDTAFTQLFYSTYIGAVFTVKIFLDMGNIFHFLLLKINIILYISCNFNKKKYAQIYTLKRLFPSQQLHWSTIFH